MQVLENEIKSKTMAIRASGVRGDLLLKYPKDLAMSLGIKAGHRFEPFYNHKGEVLFRPVDPQAVSE